MPVAWDRVRTGRRQSLESALDLPGEPAGLEGQQRQQAVQQQLVESSAAEESAVAVNAASANSASLAEGSSHSLSNHQARQREIVVEGFLPGWEMVSWALAPQGVDARATSGLTFLSVSAEVLERLHRP